MRDADSPLRQAIVDLYAQVDAPAWASPNLDGLADVLRDLSWLPEGEVVIGLPALRRDHDGPDADRLRSVLDRAVRESAGGTHAIVLDRRR